MGIIKGAARLQHHRLTTPATAFTVPPSEDFTDGTWTATDLALGEIGINLADDEIFFRTTAGIIQVPTVGGPSPYSLAIVLTAGNTTGGTDIQLTAGDVISTSASVNVIDLDYNPPGPVTDGIILGRAASNYLVVSEQQIDIMDSVNGSEIILDGAGINISTAGEIYCTAFTDIFIGSSTIRLECTSYTIGYRAGTVGTGSVVIGGTTSGAAEGEASGNYSIAMCRYSTATGADAVAIGYDALASGQYAVAIGYDALASGQYAVALGYDTTASGLRSTASGSSTIASGQSSTATGQGTTASGNFSFAGGINSSATRRGEFAFSAFGTNGDQWGIVSLVRVTTTAGAVEMFTDNSTERFVIPTDTVYSCTVDIMAVDTATGGCKTWKAHAGAGLPFLIHNVAGTTASSAITTVLASSIGVLGVGVPVVAADNVNDALTITVSGLAATNIRWFAKVTYIKLSF